LHFYLLDHEDGFGSGSSIEVLWDELDLALSSWDTESSVSVSSSGDHGLGTFSSVGWASDEELDLLVFVGSVSPSADNVSVSSLTSDVSDSVELVGGGGERGKG